MSVEDLVKTLMDELKQIVKTETVVGEAIEAGDSVIIPVSKISFGFGAGGGGGESGDEKGKGGGAGGGASVEPVAFVVITEGKVQVMSVKKELTFSKIVELVPELVGKLRDIRDIVERRREKKEDSSKDQEESDEES